MNNSQSRTHYRTVYSTSKRGLEPATVVSVSLVLLALLAFFLFLMMM